MKRIEEDIKNREFSKIYLLYGNQAYLRNQYRDKLVKAILPEGDTINYAYYQGTNLPIGEIIDLAETMPFLAEKRVIVLENTGFFEGSCPELEEYIPSIPDTTCMIFSEEKVDGRLKMIKAVKANGVAEEYSNLSEDDLRTWVLSIISKENRRVTNRALDLFLENCGTDMMFISTELDKLISYTINKDGIYPEDVEAICTVKVEDKVFLMLDEIFKHNTDGALKYYADLVTLQQPAIKIMVLIENQLKLMYHINRMDAEGLSIGKMAQELDVKEFRVKKALPIARRSSKIWIRKGLELCAEIDAASKSGRMDARIGLETIICSLSKGD